MTSSSRTLAEALGALGALGIVVLLWVQWTAPRIASPEPPDAGPGQAAPAPAVLRGKGTILGEVLLVGAPPSMQPLKLGVDPICAGASARDEQVVATDGRLQNVFVRLTDAPPQPPPVEPVVIDQLSCVFRPRVQGAVRGQSMQIRNGDRTLHNVHAYAGTSTLFNYAQPAGAPPVERAIGDGARAIKIKCDVHPWMTAYILTNDNSHFAVTGADGRFSIPFVPPGSYHLEAWHERFGVKRAEVKLGDGETARVAFSYSPEDRG